MNYNEASSFVSNLYYAYLGRAPDADGLNWWVNRLLNGTDTSDSVSAGFAYSNEGMRLAINNMYQNELGHAAGEDAFAYWVPRLQNGDSTGEVWRQIQNSQEGVNYRATHSAEFISQQDPRIAKMRAYDIQGNAVVDYRAGDSLESIAYYAYDNPSLWWVIAATNNAMTAVALATKAKIIIPDIRNIPDNPHVVQIADTVETIQYINTITGDPFIRYVIPVSSQLEGQYEDNPNWFRDLAFVNGNDYRNRNDFYIARLDPNPLMPPSYWDTMSNAVNVLPQEIDTPVYIDTTNFDQIPVFTGQDYGIFPPPPQVRYTPGSDPISVVNMLKTFPDQVQTTLKLSNIVVISVKRSIIEYIPSLRGQQIPGWPPGVKWDQSPGGFDSRRNIVVVATDSDMEKHGSKNLGRHELGHAYDYAMGNISESPTFEAAFKADFDSLANASPVTHYYTAPDAGGVTHKRAQGEAYAESFANYYSGNAKWFADKPALLNYFRSLPQPVQVGGR